jgi:hypothetical protein
MGLPEGWTERALRLNHRSVILRLYQIDPERPCSTTSSTLLARRS